MKRLLLIISVTLALSACDTADNPATPSSVKQTEDIPFQSCEAARKAGEAPLHRGEAEYNSRLDADGDGTACE